MFSVSLALFHLITTIIFYRYADQVLTESGHTDSKRYHRHLNSGPYEKQTS
jgi:hypothetical protein